MTALPARRPASPARALRLPACVVAVLALAVACSSGGSGSATPSPSASFGTIEVKQGAAPAPDARGPYAVGFTRFSATDAARTRTLPIDVWYPVAPAAAKGRPAARYELATGIGFASKAAVTGAPVDRGPFPLVVFSHGSGGIPAQSTFFTEILASRGFVVAAPEHVGNTASDLLKGTALPNATLRAYRPQDVSFTVTTLLERSAKAGDLLTGTVDAARIGVAGHSYGGYTALVTPGGISSAEDDGGPAVPPDPRIKAVVAMAPSVSFVTEATLRKDTVPTLLFGGTKDTLVPIPGNITRTAGLVTGRPLYTVDLTGASHYSFTDICGYPAVLAANHIPLAGVPTIADNLATTCRPPALAIADVHRLIDTYAVAFFEKELTSAPGDERYFTDAYARTQPAVAFTARP